MRASGKALARLDALWILPAAGAAAVIAFAAASKSAAAAAAGIVALGASAVLAFIAARSLRRPLGAVSSGLRKRSERIASSSKRLSETAQGIAAGTMEQAAGIEETSSSLEELGSMVSRNLESITEASRLSEMANAASQRGSERMSAMMEAMNGISRAAGDIRAVIDVIDDIAFQTNMLALNAAVEAARAGEAGMGFAVVADEVKGLATRSSQSAKETARMIREALSNVETGLGISGQLSEIFKEILDDSAKVLEMNRGVESASRQQDEGISQVNRAMLQFDAAVQSNAAGTERTATAAEELSAEAAALNGLVGELRSIVEGGAARGRERDPPEPRVAAAPRTARRTVPRTAPRMALPTAAGAKQPRSGRVERAVKESGRTAAPLVAIADEAGDEGVRAVAPKTAQIGQKGERPTDARTSAGAKKGLGGAARPRAAGAKEYEKRGSAAPPATGKAAVMKRTEPNVAATIAHGPGDAVRADAGAVRAVRVRTAAPSAAMAPADGKPPESAKQGPVRARPAGNHVISFEDDEEFKPGTG